MSQGGPLRLSLQRDTRGPPAGIARPRYDRERMSDGVVHFGPGAFSSRAPGVLLRRSCWRIDPDWAICAVALQSSGVRDALAPQDGLYTLAVLDEAQSFQVIGAMRELLVAPRVARGRARTTVRSRRRDWSRRRSPRRAIASPATALSTWRIPTIAHDLRYAATRLAR